MYIHLMCLSSTNFKFSKEKKNRLFAMCMAYHIGNEHGVRFIKASRQLKMKTNTHECLQAK